MIIQPNIGILIFNNAVNSPLSFLRFFFFVSIEYLVQRLNYTQACVYDSDCIPTLVCPTVPGVCNCSQYLPDLVCNCPNTKYYDSTLFQCSKSIHPNESSPFEFSLVNRATYNGACLTSANYTCLMPLYCNAGVCACPMGTSWFAGNSTCITAG